MCVRKDFKNGDRLKEHGTHALRTGERWARKRANTLRPEVVEGIECSLVVTGLVL